MAHISLVTDDIRGVKHLTNSNSVRVSAQRKARLEAGWTEVRIWAASRDDVQAIRQFTDELRMNIDQH